MKKLSITVYATVFFGCFLGKAQVIRQASAPVTPVAPIPTNPPNISQFEISGRLITQNGFVGTGVIPTAQQTGNFGTTARWNSMGSLNAGTQLLNGFRTQTDGRGLTMGYSVVTTVTPQNPVLGVTNPTIQWIGNNSLSPIVPPGDLEFRVVDNPGGVSAPANDRLVLRLGADGSSFLGTNAIPAGVVPGVYLSQINSEGKDGGLFVRSVTDEFGTDRVGIASVVNFQGTGTGITATSVCTGTLAGTSSTGVYGFGNGGALAIGVHGFAKGSAPTKYGVYGTILGTNATSFAGYFAGNVFCTGAYLPSDEKLKTKIQSEETSLQQILKLKPVNYYYTATATADLKMPSTFQHGFIAQELETIFPEMITKINAPVFDETKNESGVTLQRMESFKGINYTMLIPMLTKAMQEQQQIIEAQNQRIANLEIASKTTLASTKGYTLSQNVPNPFTDNTTIAFNLPNLTDKAVLMVTDLNGKMLLQYNLAKGSTQQVISGKTLTAGIYIYSLIINGNEMISKRMVLTK